MTHPLLKKHAPDGLYWMGAFTLGAVLLLVSLVIVAGASGFALAQGEVVSLRALGTLTAVLTIPRQLLVLGVGVGLAVVGSQLAAADAESGHVSDLRLTPLRPASILRGYLTLTLYRLRYGIAIMVGTLPVTHVFSVSIALLRLSEGRLDASVFASPAITIANSIIITALIIIGMAAVGVGLGLTFGLRGVGIAGSLAVFLLLVMSVSGNVLPRMVAPILGVASVGVLMAAVTLGMMLTLGVLALGGYIIGLRHIKAATP
jgi:hypothetical protein